jgi:hypothetical protein
MRGYEWCAAGCDEMNGRSHKNQTQTWLRTEPSYEVTIGLVLTIIMYSTEIPIQKTSQEEAQRHRPAQEER